MSWQDTYKQKLVSVDEAASKIKSHDRIIYGPSSGSPIDLLEAIGRRYRELEDVKMTSGLTLTPFSYMKGDCLGHVGHHTIFMGPVERKMMPEGNVEVTSICFSHLDWVIKNVLKPNIYLAEVSPPDENGFMSLGHFGAFYSSASIATADTIIVQVNRESPYVYGDQSGPKKTMLSVDEVAFICEADHKLPALPDLPVSETDKKMASYILEYFSDGVTVQLGIGGVANAIGFSLDSFKDIGVHTEMMTDSMMDLMQKGTLIGKCKTLHPNEVSFGFALGSEKLYKFLDHNPGVRNYPLSYITNPYVIAQNKKMMSINGSMMCDLTGQTCSESIGFAQYSCTGGQLDFVRGAQLSEGGMSFICFPSTTKGRDGSVTSKITTSLPPGAVITTPRTDVQYVVTEYGIANMRDQSIEQRVKAMIKIAHPQFRDQLAAEAKKVGLVARSERVPV